MAIYVTGIPSAAHVEDTLNAGMTLQHPPSNSPLAEVTDRRLVGFARHADLREDQADDEFREFLTMEGGHSHRRVIHAADQAGRALGCLPAGSSKPRHHPVYGSLSGRCHQSGQSRLLALVAQHN